MEYRVYPGRVEGEILIPASKSHTIRALLIASMAEGDSLLINPLDSEDTRSCIRASKALAIGALGARGPVTIQTAEAASVTFPGFFQLLESIRRDKSF